jgi:SAM-dependent MidA family methyltransferase
MTPLGGLIAARIAAEGPMRLDVYMGLCLGHPEHGYYMTRDPFGASGDFVTAPEVSQMFGELVGAWAAQVWADAGAPDPFVLAELGPGRGTLMQDALRAAAGMPGFLAAARLCLVETSPVLRARQAEALAARTPAWAGSVAALPAGPLVVVANEFFDALPIRQFQRLDALWRERLIDLADGRLVAVWGAARGDADLDRRFPQAGDGAVVEVSTAGEAVAAALGARIARDGVAALVFDYGVEAGVGDTLQALKRHAPVDPLAEPGEADLTAHVGFAALAAAARPARAWGPVPQGLFLERLGIGARARALARKGGAAAAAVAAAHRRLTDSGEMGNLLRVLALTRENVPPPGFEG